MKKVLIAMVLTAVCGTASAQPLEIKLWPDGAPEDNGITAPERHEENGNWWNTSEAAMYVYPADKSANTGRAMLICPGGGYAMLSASHEGKMFAEWFAAGGITAVVLKYRLPNRHSEIPLADAMQAMKLLRENAKEWGVDPSKIGVMGFSAGGHLASTLLTHYDSPQTRPSFGILYYPVISMGELTHQSSRDFLLGENPTPEAVDYYSSELQVTGDTPPTMIFFSNDDGLVDSRNGVMFYDALKQNKVGAALYIFPSGEHGWGFGPWFPYHEQMKALTMDWISRF
ncbi:MAG: alpha/beta hydrolase [Rikenellaceae bacterium]|jgi:acetyl esterase/lipase|nr:alpha/beta hydrolase [Rikenellaceae bacterium]